MTREEAIRELKIFSGTTKTRFSANFWEALNRAIKALEQEPCGDAVSIQAVNELFDSEIKMYEERIETRKGSNYYDQTERIKEFRSRIANAEYWQNKIEALPPVTPTRKKGKWIRHEERKPLKYGYELIIKGKCSNCGEVFGETYKMNYCPNCGAEMESEKNEQRSIKSR